MGALEASLLTYPDDTESIEHENKVKETAPASKPSAQPPRFFNDPIKSAKRKGAHENGCRPSSKPAQKFGAHTKSNIDTLQNLKSAYFNKMQSLNKKLEDDRAIHRKQLENKRTISRSKSPMQQPNRNMPRQISGNRNSLKPNSLSNTAKTKSYGKVSQPVNKAKPVMKTTTS